VIKAYVHDSVKLLERAQLDEIPTANVLFDLGDGTLIEIRPNAYGGLDVMNRGRTDRNALVVRPKCDNCIVIEAVNSDFPLQEGLGKKD
jgi:hypothetical protein